MAHILRDLNPNHVSHHVLRTCPFLNERYGNRGFSNGLELEWLKALYSQLSETLANDQKQEDA